MGWEEKDEYAINLISTNLLTPNRVIDVVWPEELASFVLEVTPLLPPDVTLPCDQTSELREARYKVYLQGIHEGQVFWAPLGHYAKRRYTIDQEIGEVLWQIYKDFGDGTTLQQPRLRVIAPTEMAVTLDSTRLGYKH